MRTLSRTFVVSAVAALAAGCAAPDAAQVPISDQARNAPLPRLVPTDRFSSALAGAEPDTERLQADAATLAARAAALRARAAALSVPVIDPDARTRLDAAAVVPGGTAEGTSPPQPRFPASVTEPPL